jgi:hypothetical protein
MLENIEAVEAKKPAKLFVATPMYGGLCTGGYTMGILNCSLKIWIDTAIKKKEAKFM